MTRKLHVKDASGERELLLVGTMRVGRDPRCEITSADPILSRQHAEFIDSGGRTIVRDLESRHGILVNGVRATEATLQPGDIVQIAGVTVTFVVEASESGVTTAPEVPAADQTVVLRRSPAAAPPAPASPPVAPPPPRRPEPPSDQTVLARPASVPAPPPPQPAVARQSPPAPAVAPPDAGEVPLGKTPPVPKPRKRYRLSWSMGVSITLFVLVAIAVVATLVPFQIYGASVVEANAQLRAQALGRWLAGEASASMAGVRDLTSVAEEVGAQAGVERALLLDPDGSVIAPAARQTERYPTVPEIGSIAEVFVVKVAHAGDVIEVVAPVRGPGDTRVALAWVTFRPSAGTAVSPIVFLVPALVIALVAWLVAARVVKRRVLSSLTHFGEDIELATAGQIDEVGDTLGVKPMEDVARAVNYLVARIRASAGGQAPARPAPAVQRAAARIVPSSRPEPVLEVAARECTITASEKFRITEATDGTFDLLGVEPAALMGQHLLDAIPERAVGDAMLSLLTEVTQGGSKSARVAVAQGGALAVHVSRTGPNAPITARFVREES